MSKLLNKDALDKILADASTFDLLPEDSQRKFVNLIISRPASPTKQTFNTIANSDDQRIKDESKKLEQFLRRMCLLTIQLADKWISLEEEISELKFAGPRTKEYLFKIFSKDSTLIRSVRNEILLENSSNKIDESSASPFLLSLDDGSFSPLLRIDLSYNDTSTGSTGKLGGTSIVLSIEDLESFIAHLNKAKNEAEEMIANLESKWVKIFQ